jgi:hypothetical protein
MGEDLRLARKKFIEQIRELKNGRESSLTLFRGKKTVAYFFD